MKTSKNFILVTRDGDSIAGTKINAKKIVEARLSKNQWPIYENTRGRKSFSIGSKVAFYIGGTSLESGNIVATGIIEKINNSNNRSLDNGDLIEEPPSLLLEFTNISFLKKPVSFREKLESLSFCPKNLRKWGVILIGGCRQLTDQDWKIIFS